VFKYNLDELRAAKCETNWFVLFVVRVLFVLLYALSPIVVNAEVPVSGRAFEEMFSSFFLCLKFCMSNCKKNTLSFTDGIVGK
jgi:hypothetical protein